MSKEVQWNKLIFDTFVSEAMLSELEINILKTRIAGWTTVKQSLEFNMSVANINRIIATLKIKYDNVSAYCPTLPARNTKYKIHKE